MPRPGTTGKITITFILDGNASRLVTMDNMDYIGMWKDGGSNKRKVTTWAIGVVNQERGGNKVTITNVSRG